MGLCQNIEILIRGCFLATSLLSICSNMQALREIVKSVKMIFDPLSTPFPTIPFQPSHMKKVDGVLHGDQHGTKILNQSVKC